MEQKIKDAAAALGALLKDCPEMIAADAAEAAYLADEALQAKIDEYGAQQQAISEIAADDQRAELRGALEHRLDTLYEEITVHPLYCDYAEKKQMVSQLMHEVNEEINFAITGERGCSGDCHSCSGCH